MSGISFSNLAWVEAEYQKYLADPSSVDPKWRYFFEGWDMAQKLAPQGQGAPDLKVYHLIEAYRTYGHLAAQINPIALKPPDPVSELEIEKHGFQKSDLDSIVPTFGFLKEPQAPLKNLIEALKKTYCGTIGFEYKGLRMPELEAWLQERIEPRLPELSSAEKLNILHELNRAEIFETVLHRKYTGQTRFSLEGEETLIPVLSAILDAAAEEGIAEAVMGMQHRGRLNVLTNIVSKPYLSVFHEFEDYFIPDWDEGVGGAPYHCGFTGHFKTRNGKEVKVVLAANPSHLEAVDPVVEGFTRARQEIEGSEKIVPILMHGEAALAGQGIVYETLQMNRLNGYKTGGTIHIAINNQIGFTTIPKDYESTRYPTAIAQAFGAPVFHVNAEHPDECILAARFAVAIRQKFQSDVFINLNGFRKYGHNEGDEPAFTQPVHYQLIRSKKSPRVLYRDQLIQEGLLDSAAAQKMEDDFRKELQETMARLPPSQEPAPKKTVQVPLPLADTAVTQEALVSFAEDFCKAPEGFHLHPKVKKLLEDRLEMLRTSIDWGMAEYLTYASLLAEGTHVRISGQDSRRGTFSHRHAVLVDTETEERYYPLSHLKAAKARFDVFNSHLSEEGVLGFEFGYTLGYPKALVIWEAQYGDFANEAQTQIDQFVTSHGLKWGTPSSLVMFLPHGYEGQGAEHSSARLERFLQLTGDDNIIVAICSTPAQLFHLLRRQVLAPSPRPLVLMTHKGILRYAPSFSPLAAFSSGTFEEFIDDPVENPRRVMFCSGRVYYDLLSARKTPDTALVRIEQLYPFNKDKFVSLASKYKNLEWIWVQEEPKNMGAWNYMRPIFEEVKPIRYIGRVASGVAAASSHAQHKRELKTFLQECFE